MARSTRDTPFGETVPFRMHRVTATTVASANEDFARHGVNVQGARVLVVVLQNPGITIGEVAEITCIELSTLSHMLRRFERDGLITRNRLPDDNRSVSVTLTARGRLTASSVHEIVKSHQAIMLAGITQRDIAVFRRVLAKMAANVEATAEHATAPRKAPAARRPHS